MSLRTLQTRIVTQTPGTVTPPVACGVAESATSIDLVALGSDPPEGTDFGDVGGGGVTRLTGSDLLYISIGTAAGLLAVIRRMQIWDVSDLTAPLNLINVLGVPVQPGDPASPLFLDEANDRLYSNSSIDQFRIVIYDIAIPTAPVVLGTLGTLFAFSGANSDLKVPSLTTAFAVHQSTGRLESYDITIPAAPTLLQSKLIGFPHVPAVAGPLSLAVDGTLGYTVNSSTPRLAVWDLSVPTAMVFVGSVLVPTTAGSIFNGQVVKVGSLCYIALGENFSIVDVTVPAAPVLLSQTVSGTSAIGVIVTGSNALVLDRNDKTVTVWNVSNPAAPTLCATINLVTTGAAFTLDGTDLFVAERFSGAINDTLEIFDVSACLC